MSPIESQKTEIKAIPTSSTEMALKLLYRTAICTVQ